MSKVQRLSRKGVGKQVYGFSKQYSPIKGGDIVRHPWKHGSSFTNYVTVALEDRISALTTKDPAKIQVYEEGYDGHSLRAQAYFGEAMPDIERAPAGAKCYKAMLGTKEIYFHEHETIMYMGKKVTGAELYQLLSV